MFFVVTPVPLTHTLCVLATCTFVKSFAREAGAFIDSHTYQSGRAFYLGSHSKFVSEFSLPLFLTQISCRKRPLRLKMKTYKPCSCRHEPREETGPSQKVWEAFCWGMGRGLCCLC